MAARQGNKPNNIYSQEIKDLSKMLTNAYITDSWNAPTANIYAVQTTVKPLTKNVNSDRTKIIIEASNFENIEQITPKLASTDAYRLGTSNILQVHGGSNKDRQTRSNYRNTISI